MNQTTGSRTPGGLDGSPSVPSDPARGAPPGHYAAGIRPQGPRAVIPSPSGPLLARAAMLAGILGAESVPALLGLEDGEIDAIRDADAVPLGYAVLIADRMAEAVEREPAAVVRVFGWGFIPAGDPVAVFHWWRGNRQRAGMGWAAATMAAWRAADQWQADNRPDEPPHLLAVWLAGERIEEAEVWCALADMAANERRPSPKRATILAGIAAKIDRGGRLTEWERATALAWAS